MKKCILFLLLLPLLISCRDITNNSSISNGEGKNELASGDGNNRISFSEFSNSKVNAYRVSNLFELVEGPILSTEHGIDDESVGIFRLELNNISDEEWVLVEVISKAVPGDKKSVHHENKNRKLYALARAEDWRNGINVSLISDIAWRYTKPWLDAVSQSALNGRLTEVANFLLRNKNTKTETKYREIIKFDPNDNDHVNSLTFNYDLLFEANGFVDGIRNGIDEAGLLKALDGIFLPNLSASLPEHLEDEVRIELSVFGRGEVFSDQFGLRAGSEVYKEEVVSKAFLKNDDAPLVFTATPTSETLIDSWTGCDRVSSDLRKCYIDRVHANRLVEANFAYRDIDIIPGFIDASKAISSFQGSSLLVEVPPKELALMQSMANISGGEYLTALTDQGPQILSVLSAAKSGVNSWLLTVEKASLSDIIKQGTAIFKTKLTYGDLDLSSTVLGDGGGVIQSASSYSRLHDSLEGLHVELVEPNDPKETTFELRIGRVASNDYVQAQSGLDNASWIVDDEAIETTAKFAFDIDLDVGASYGLLKGLEDFRFMPEITFDASLGVGATGELNTPTDEHGNDLLRKKLGTLQFKPIIFFVGIVPVYITPKMDFYVGVNGKVEAMMSVDTAYTSKVRAGVVYNDRDGWSTIRSSDSQWMPLKPVIDGEASVQGYISVQPELKLYDATGPELDLKASLRFSAEQTLGRL